MCAEWVAEIVSTLLPYFHVRGLHKGIYLARPPSRVVARAAARGLVSLISGFVVLTSFRTGDANTSILILFANESGIDW